MIEVRRIVSNSLSRFRTHHEFIHYGEFATVEEYAEFLKWSRSHRIPLFILANGSNVFFNRRRVKSLVLKNRLDKWMRPIGQCSVEASSSMPLSIILKYCQENSLESFYYLASVPATVGGAIAMNAGRGRKYHQTIFDFVESVTYWENGEVRTVQNSEIERDYRWTMFTGIQDKLILSACFQFPLTSDTSDRIAARIEYSKREQDLSAPNCGSVFKESNGRIMLRLRGLRIDGASYSPKTINWILNRSSSVIPLRILIWAAKAAHYVVGKRARLELIEVK